MKKKKGEEVDVSEIVPGTQADVVLSVLGSLPGAKIFHGQVFKPDAHVDDVGPCTVCGKTGVWITGAGRYMCAKHQDDY